MQESFVWWLLLYQVKYLLFPFFQTNGMTCLLSAGVFSCSGLLKTMCKTISLICAPSTLTVAKKGNKFIADGCVNVF